MPRPLVVFVLFLSACCHLCRDCPVNPRCEDAEGQGDANVADAPVDLMIVDLDASVVDAIDAAPRPIEPVLDQCVGHRGESDPGCLDQDPFERKINGGPVRSNGTMVRATMGNKECGQLEKQANIGGSLDVDVFRTGECQGSIISLDPLRPWVELTNELDAALLRVCIFPTCSAGSTNVFACLETPEGVSATDSTPASPADLYNSEVGFRGCCRNGPGRVTAKTECPRDSTAIDTYIWVDAGPSSDPADRTCHPYKIRHKMM